MKYYSLYCFIYIDETFVVLHKEATTKKDDSITFVFNHICGEPDWDKILKAIRFFDAEYVSICPRFDNADEFTSPEPTVTDCDVEYAVREKEETDPWQEPKYTIKDTGRYQSGYRIYRSGYYREDFGSDM